MSIHGQILLSAIQTIRGNNTKQIGRLFCIPASLCNGLRVLGVSSITQELIRDIYYSVNQREVEPDINNQMQRVSFDVIDAVEHHVDYKEVFSTEHYLDAEDYNIFDCSKAERALQFIRRHLEQDHPVIVSTWWVPWDHGILQPQCCHMWLALAYDDNTMLCTLHDPDSDQIFQIPFYLSVPLFYKGQRQDLEIGLRGRITHTDYKCCALIKR